MSDIVEKLLSNDLRDFVSRQEAADTITRLRAEVERLAKLRTIELEHSNRWLEERDALRAHNSKLRAELREINERISAITRAALDPDVVLTEAIGKLEGVVITGFDKEGNSYFASSYSDGGNALWLLEICKKTLLEVGDE